MVFVMGKSKREIKKEVKKEMKDKMKTKLKVKVKKKMKKVKLLFIVLTILAAVVAVAKAIEMLLEKKNKNRPKDTSLDQVFSLFAAAKDSLYKKITGGVMVGSYFSTQRLDCSGCEFKDGSFIAIKSCLAYVNVIIPENVNVKFDCIDLFTYVKQEYDTEEFDESLPTVYIALKGAFSSVIITKAESTYTENEEELNAAEA